MIDKEDQQQLARAIKVSLNGELGNQNKITIGSAVGVLSAIIGANWYLASVVWNVEKIAIENKAVNVQNMRDVIRVERWVDDLNTRVNNHQIHHPGKSEP